MLIISLSSIPPRFSQIGPTLQSLRAQKDPADRILLYIPRRYRRFPDWDGALPEVPEGVKIRRVDNDLGPATKVLCAAREYQGQDVDILFCDDDRFYPPDTVTRFTHLRTQHPDCAIALVGRQAETIGESSGRRDRQPRAVRRWRATDVEFQLRFLWSQIRAGRNWRRVAAPHRRVYKRSGYVDIFEGCGGVLVRPEFFDEMAYDIPPVLWTVDDVWLSGMIARKGVPIWLQANLMDPPETDADALSPLAFSVIEGADRGVANRMALKYMQDHFGIWP